MIRKNCKDKKELVRLDEVNDERLENTKKRVAHAIGLLKSWTWHTISSDEGKQSMLRDLSHAVNLLEAAEEEMKWHCEWYDYDQEVCAQIDDACLNIGITMADLINAVDDEFDVIVCSMKDGLIRLSKVLATLIRWNDESANVSEV